jgi:ABC-type sugar transport system permease subunit
VSHAPASGRWRVATLACVAAGALFPLGAARWAGARYERVRALRSAGTTAAYLALVTPAGRGSSDYDLAQLLIQARALATLTGFTAQVEVYHGTAPLVRATAPPLQPGALDRLRRQTTPDWEGGAALAPLLDRDGWNVVGAVAARVETGAWPSLRTLAALLLALAAGALAGAAVGGGGARLRRALLWYAPAAALLGGSAYGDVRTAARGSTDLWLADARLLVQEATARLPPPRAALATLAPIAGNAELVPGDTAGTGPWRRAVGGVPRAAVAVRLGPGRWAELRVLPAEVTAVGWLALTLGLALLGPVGAAVAGWGAREAARPRRRRETAAAWGFLAPSALHLAVFSFAPILLVLYFSVHRSSHVEPVHPFVGPSNFMQLLRDPLVWVSLRNTAAYALHVPVSMALALAAALAVRGVSPAARAVRTLLVIPSVSSVVAVALVWQWMYHPDLGLINYLLSLARVGPVDWLGNPKTALVAVMLLSIWTQLGYQMTVFLAGLHGIPQAYLDAARVDGASAWQRFWKVTWPLLKPVTLFVLVTGIIGSFQVFTVIYVLTDGGPAYATEVIVNRIYQTAWKFLEFGYASALSLLLFVVLFGATWTQFRLLDKRVEYA